MSKSKRYFNVNFLTYYFHMKTKILADFQICISVPIRKRDQLKYLKNRFDNKNIEKINLSPILLNLLIKEALPNTSAYFNIPTNVYNMPNAIGSKIFIFNKFLDSLDMMAFLDDNFTLPYDCAGYPIFDKIIITL